MSFMAGLVIGLVIGAVGSLAVAFYCSRRAAQQMKESFTTIASDALDANSRRLTDLAVSQLDGRKQLIDQTMAAMNERLETVRQLLARVETERKQDLGQLAGAVSSLSMTAGELHKMLASTQRRGAWGERMAEDILRLAGLQETVNYIKQSSADAETGRPDFTFLLPNQLKCNMDVKFPLEKYKSYLDSQTDEQRKICVSQLCTAVRGHIRTVAGRGYIDPNVPTVPYVIVFLPSEQMYSLVLSCEPDLMDEALAKKVVLASPLTLYAMLAVIRQAAENANIVKTADEVIAVLSSFQGQFLKYNEEMDKLGQRIDAAAKQYDVVRTTRTNMLIKPLERIEDLRCSGKLNSDVKP